MSILRVLLSIIFLFANKSFCQLPPQIQNYINKQPITTSFADAKTEINLLENFNPSNDLFSPLNSLKRTTEGKYIITPGLYTIQAKSFCMHAGTYGPRGNYGPGYLYADLQGPKADLLKEILQNWQIKAPQISQHEIQLIIWAIIARTEVSEMNQQFRDDLKKVLGEESFKKYDNGGKVKKILKVLNNLPKPKPVQSIENKVNVEVAKTSADLVRLAEESKIPQLYRNVINAEYNLNEKLKGSISAFEAFESIALLNGNAPSIFDIRKVTKGAWSYNPAGYFIRFIPSNYSSDRIDVYVPQNVQTNIDAKGRIDSIYIQGVLGLKFKYDVPKNNDLSSAQHFSIVVSVPKSKKQYKLDSLRKFAYKYGQNENDFDSNMTNVVDTGILNFRINLEPSTSTIHFSGLKNLEKKEIYNLQSLVKTFENFHTTDSFLSQSIDEIKDILTEAGNNLIYQSLFNSTSNPAKNIVLDLADNVATPANTAMQRLANADDPIPDNTHSNYMIVFFAYPASYYKNPDGTTFHSLTGHIFVGFVKNGVIEDVKGMEPGLDPWWHIGGLVSQMKYPYYVTPQNTYIRIVSQEQYEKAYAITKYVYFILINDCVTYADDVAYAIDLNRPLPQNLIFTPVAYLQYIKNNN